MFKDSIRIFLFFIILFFQAFTVYALSSQKTLPYKTFERLFPEYDIFEVDMLETEDGYIVVGEDDFYGTYKDVLVLGLDKNGEKKWEKIYNFSTHSDGAYSIIADGSGYVIAGFAGSPKGSDRDALIFKIDKEGNILWKKTYGSYRDDYATCIKPIKDGFIVAGYSKGRGPKLISFWLAKLDANGNLVWEKFYGSEYINYGYEVIVNNNGYTVAGSTRGRRKSGVYLVNTDFDGNIQWEKKIEGKSFQGLKNIDNGMLLLTVKMRRYDIIAGSFLTMITENGTTKWEKEIKSEKGNFCSRISVYKNKISAFCDAHFDKVTSQYVLTLDKNGSVVNEKKMDVNGFIRIEKLKALSNGYLIAGTVKSKEHRNYMLYVSRSDNELKISDRKEPYKVLPESKRELLYAVSSADAAYLKRLIEHGVNVRSEITEDGVTPIYIAVLDGNEEIIKILLKNGASLTGKGIFKKIPVLHTAVRGGSLWFIKEIHTKFSDIYKAQINKPDSYKKTPLAIAIVRNKNQIAEYLLNNGAAVNPDNKGAVPPLIFAVNSNNNEIAALLIKRGADIHQANPENKKTALHYAAEYKNKVLVKELLLKGADPNVRDRDGFVPLHYAAGTSPEICEMLLNNKAKVNVEIYSGKYKGQTPLQIAILTNNIKNAKQLIKHGADVNDKIAVRFLRYRGRSKEECSLLECAVISEYFIIANMLINAGADIKKPFVVEDLKGATPLHIAVLKRDYSLIMNLLHHGADINAKAEFKYYKNVTPVELAYDNGLKDIFDYTGTGKNVLNNNLAEAIIKKDHRNIKQYLEKGADVNYRVKDPQSDRDSLTMLDLAVQTGDIKIVKLITEELLKQERVYYSRRTFSTVIKNKYNKIFRYLYDKFKHTFSKYSEPSMATAVFSRNIEVLKFLLEHKHNIRNVSFNTYTVINYAFNKQSPEMAHIIRNASDLSQKNKNLYSAVYKNNMKLVKKALSSGAKINVRDLGDISPLCWAAFLGYNKIVEYLIKKGAVVQPEKLCGDRSAIYWATAMGHIDTVRLLIKNGADVRAYDPWSYECLHIAAEHGYADIVDLLLDSGADINSQSARNGGCRKAMHIAAEYGKINIIKTLLKRGQSIDVHNVNGEYWITPLMAAIQNNQIKTVLFLIDNKADLFAVSKNGDTCLHRAVYSNNKQMIKLLVEHKADINAVNAYGNSPLMLAMHNGKTEIAGYLLSLGADCSTVNHSNSSLLHIAAEKGQLELAKSIINKDSKPEINLINKDSHTPLLSAVLNNNAEMVSLFLKKGADVNLKIPKGKYKDKTVIELTKNYPVWKLLRNAGAKYRWEIE